MQFRSFTKTIMVVLAVAFLLMPVGSPAFAQDEISFSSVQVNIWPEYDQPGVLVLYFMTLAPDVSLPADMTLRIPSAAGEPHAVAMQDPNGLYNLNYTLSPAGEWTEVRFTTPVPEIHIEYYDPTLRKDGSQRNFEYRWPGDYAVENLSLEVQQPINATNMTFRPDLGAGRVGEDGLQYYSYLAGSVKKSTTFKVTISYDKADDRLTRPEQFKPVEPVQPVDSNTAGRVTLDQVLPWAIGGVGLLLITAGALLWYWRTGIRQAVQTAGRRRHTARRDAPSPAAGSEAEGAYCHHCGKKAAPGDLFCRACGTRLRG